MWCPITPNYQCLPSHVYYKKPPVWEINTDAALWTNTQTPFRFCPLSQQWLLFFVGPGSYPGTCVVLGIIVAQQFPSIWKSFSVFHSLTFRCRMSLYLNLKISSWLDLTSCILACIPGTHRCPHLCVPPPPHTALPLWLLPLSTTRCSSSLSPPAS